MNISNPSPPGLLHILAKKLIENWKDFGYGIPPGPTAEADTRRSVAAHLPALPGLLVEALWRHHVEGLAAAQAEAEVGCVPGAVASAEQALAASLGIRTGRVAEARHVAGAPGSILAVDDDPLMHLLIERASQCLAHRLDAVTSVQEAISALKGNDYSLVLLDCHLKDGHGEGVARFALTGRPAVPVVTLSSDDDPSTVQRMRNAGVREYLVKPVSIAGLRAVIAKYLTAEA